MTSALTPKGSYRVTKADRRLFWYIMLPALVESVVNQLFGMIDTLMVGNTVNSAVNIAAVSLGNTPHQFILCVLNAFTIGTTTAIAFYTGSGEKHKIGATVRQSALFILLLSTAVTVLSLIFAPAILSFVGADGELHEISVRYFRIIIAVHPIEMLTVVATASLRGIGISKFPMIYNLIAGGLNVAGNYVLIYGKFGFPEMGIAGAALSTSLSKCIAFAIALYCMAVMKTEVRINFRESFLFTRPILGRVASVGMTTMLEQVLLQGGNVIAVKIVAGMDTASIAAYNICQTINGLSWRPGGACQVASTTFAGRDMGERRPDKARARALMVYRYGLYFCAGMAFFLFFFRYPVASLFSPVENIRHMAGQAMIFDAFSTIGVTSHLIFSGSLRASGDQKYPLIASMVSIWTARVGIALLFSQLGILTVFTARLCNGIDQMIRGSIVSLRFFTSKRFRSPIPSSKGESDASE